MNLDYLYSAEEVAFLSRSWPDAEDSCRTIVEVGAGFGRTAHALLSAWPWVTSYTIIDLPETLALSREYLSRILPHDLLSKCTFVDASVSAEVDFVLSSQTDLAIQVDGLQEMPSHVIDAYFSELFDLSRHCFFSTPVGKYMPETAGLSSVDGEKFRRIMTLGRCRTVIDPWSEESLGGARSECLEVYRPRDAVVVSAAASRLRPHYLHSLYRQGN